jgi:sugar diacid utilization regulator
MNQSDNRQYSVLLHPQAAMQQQLSYENHYLENFYIIFLAQLEYHYLLSPKAHLLAPLPEKNTRYAQDE